MPDLGSPNDPSSFIGFQAARSAERPRRPGPQKPSGCGFLVLALVLAIGATIALLAR